MLPNTSEMSQLVSSVLQKTVWLISSDPKNYGISQKIICSDVLGEIWSLREF